MSVGLGLPSQATINTDLSNIILNLNQLENQIVQFFATMEAIPDGTLEAAPYTFTMADVAVLRSTYRDLYKHSLSAAASTRRLARSSHISSSFTPRNGERGRVCAGCVPLTIPDSVSSLVFQRVPWEGQPRVCCGKFAIFARKLAFFVSLATLFEGVTGIGLGFPDVPFWVTFPATVTHMGPDGDSNATSQLTLPGLVESRLGFDFDPGEY
jgi:hypothetical protein